MLRLPKRLTIAAALVALAAGLYVALPSLIELSVEAACPATAPDRSCVFRMRALGDAWSLKGDLARAKPWYERAAAAGDTVAMFELGWLHQQLALEQVRQLMAQRAQKRPALPPLRETSGGITKLDPVLAERALAGAAPGAPDAEDRAAVMALEANGQLAASWYRRAAEQGFAPAMNNLGEVYRYGITGWRDMAEAFRWYQAAAAAGNPIGLWNVGAAYATGQGVGRDQFQADKWSTWYPNPNGGASAELGEPVLQRTTLFGATMSPERRANLRAAAKAGTPVTVTISASKASPAG